MPPYRFLAVVLFAGMGSTVWGAPPSTVEDRAAAVGSPTAINVFPASVELVGMRDARQLVVTGTYADGSVRDLTAFATLTVEPAGVVEIRDGLLLRGKADGKGTITITAGGRTAQTPVIVRGMSSPTTVSFRHDVVAVMNVGGCNMGACHGTPSGKNGFKLSLRGFDPGADFLQLTRDQSGRRTDRHAPAESLLLLKAVGRVPHEGGQRFAMSSLPAELLTAWLREGLTDDGMARGALKKVEVTPSSRVLKAPARWQQLAVAATYADGTTRDVTQLSNFSSSDPVVAEVTPTGFVEFKQTGEVAILCRYLDGMTAVRLTYLELRPGFVWPNPVEKNFIDTHVYAKLKQMSIPTSGLCSDTEFIRRAYLDAVGRLPTPAESRAFFADPSPGKRDALIDRLVQLPEFADFWALKWGDVLKSSRKTIQKKGSYGMRTWLRGKLAANTPMDEIVRDLLTADGNTSANPPANYYRVNKDPQVLAETTAQLFLGVRMQCAKCHNHPFERWSQDDYYGLAAFFARVKVKPEPTLGTPPAKNAKGEHAEVVFSMRDGELTQPRTNKTMPPHFPGAGDAPIPPGEDRRQVLAAWLTSPDNPFFARAIANRVWFHLLGKGIVDPVDDFRESNPSCNDPLLEALGKDFAGHKFELKHLVATIMKSATYQASAATVDSNGDDARYFSHALVRMLTAEQVLDALCDVTGVPEKFAGLPPGTRAVQLPDSDVNHPFLKAFGQPARELACECEREAEGNVGQAIQMVNGPTVGEKLRNPANRLGKLLEAKASDEQILDELYLAAFSRYPTPSDKALILGRVKVAPDRRRAWEDVLWVLLNTREFQFRH